jgi:hypothetical protein
LKSVEATGLLHHNIVIGAKFWGSKGGMKSVDQYSGVHYTNSGTLSSGVPVTDLLLCLLAGEGVCQGAFTSSLDLINIHEYLEVDEQIEISRSHPRLCKRYERIIRDLGDDPLLV